MDHDYRLPVGSATPTTRRDDLHTLTAFQWIEIRFAADCVAVDRDQTSINDTSLSYTANDVRYASSSRLANWLSSWSLRTNPAPSPLA